MIAKSLGSTRSNLSRRAAVHRRRFFTASFPYLLALKDWLTAFRRPAPGARCLSRASRRRRSSYSYLSRDSNSDYPGIWLLERKPEMTLILFFLLFFIFTIIKKRTDACVRTAWFICRGLTDGQRYCSAVLEGTVLPCGGRVTAEANRTLTSTITSIFKHIFYCLPIYLKISLIYLLLSLTIIFILTAILIKYYFFLPSYQLGSVFFPSPLTLNWMSSEERKSYLDIICHGL
jgi:hypothetical protein